jgi:hypothetical protein
MLDAFYSGVTSCVDPDCRKSLKVPNPSSLPLVDLTCLPCRLAGKTLTQPHEVSKHSQSYDASVNGNSLADTSARYSTCSTCRPQQSHA